ncbi:hypothetical protein JCM10212_003382 [Sporobolomyces blumeae]
MASETTPLLSSHLPSAAGPHLSPIPRPTSDSNATTPRTSGSRASSVRSRRSRRAGAPAGEVTLNAQDEIEFPEDWIKLKDCNVFQSAHAIYRMFTSEIPIAITEEQMRDPNVVLHLNDVLRRELEDEHNSPSIVYVLLLCRLQFLRERNSALASTSLCETRANYCEYFAVHMLRHQGRMIKGLKMQQLAMARALVGGLHAFQGASEEVLERIRKNEGGTSRVYAEGAGKTNALELAVLGKAKKFIKSDACQRVIAAIYDGRITYSSSSFLDLLPDRWKTKDISLYNVRAAPLLDHYRLRVPKYRSMIDSLSFAVLFFSFLHVIIDRHSREELVHLSTSEIWFFFYALGYSLDRSASIFEHGWHVFAMGLTTPLDILSVPIYVSAFVLRVHSFSSHDPVQSDRAYAILSCAACLLFPRIAFTAISKNVFILSLRAMLAEFFYLMGVTVFCFLGFVFALNHLCDGEYSVTRISEWLVMIYFGLDGTGIDKSPKFDPVLGPILFISFAALSNTLLTAVLVAILSSTYSKIAVDADAENMFRKAVMTLEGVKSDSLFDYMPPVNLVAITVLLPLSHILSERKFHSLNVLCTRILSLPILLLIALYERQRTSEASLRDVGDRLWTAFAARLPESISQKLTLMQGAHWETEACFAYTPSGDEKSDGEEEEDAAQLGGDEGIEEWILEGKGPDGQRRVSSRLSMVMDAAKSQEPHSDLDEGPSNVDSAARPATTPIAISRQTSFHRPTGSPVRSPPTRKSTAISFESAPAEGNEQSILKRTRRRTRQASPPSAVEEAPRDATVQFGSTPKPPHRANTISVGERLPPNASASSSSAAYPFHHAESTKPTSSSPRQAVEFPQLTSTSAPTRDSPFIRRYLNGETVSTNGTSLGRRLSLSQSTRARAWSEVGNSRAPSLAAAVGGGGGGSATGSEGVGADPLSAAQMMRMIQGLVATVERLERKIDERDERDGRGKARARDVGDESAIDDDDDDG